MLSRKIQLFCVDGTPVVIVRALYPELLTVSRKVRLYFHETVPGARAGIIALLALIP